MLRARQDTAIATRENAFDLLRLLACGTVVFSHSYALAGGADPLHGILDVQLATIGVFMLFALSGYLLAGSVSADDRVIPYWIKRALRLVPGLVLCALLTALVLGPLVTSLSASSYLTHAGTYTFVAKQSVFDVFRSHLPGVFLHNPLPRIVNGSLWTLPLEVCCYAALIAASATGILKRPRILLAVVLLVCAALVVVAPPDDPHGVSPHGIKLLANALRPCGAFACGALLWVVRDRLPRNWAWCVLALAAIVAPLPSGVHSAIDIVAVPYLVVVVGSLRPGPLRRLLLAGDVSYGVYIYSFPLQQTLVQYLGGITPLELLALSAPLSWLAGAASWRLIERRALALKRVLIRPRPAERSPDPLVAASARASS